MIVRDHQDVARSAEEIVRQQPYLTRAEVHAASGYYFDHQEEIDEEIGKENRLLEEVNQKDQPPVAEKLRVLKKSSECTQPSTWMPL